MKILSACTRAILAVGATGFLQAQSPESAGGQKAPAPRAEAAASAFPAETRPATPANSVNAPAIAAAAGDYVLSPSDTIEMTVFREPDLTTRSRVGSDGSVQLPLIGDVRIAGLTVRVAREVIRKRYDADYLVDPQVYLNIVEYAPRNFTILGQVVKPGTYDFPAGRPLSLLEAVGMAGGFTRSADRGRVTAKRAGGPAGESTIKINAKKLAADGKDSFQLQPGDIITVGESWF
jgi:polysaccharide export outer membrane protein